MSFQLKCMFCSKTFATGPTKLGNVVCQMLGGGGVSEPMDGRGCAILALELVSKNLIFA